MPKQLSLSDFGFSQRIKREKIQTGEKRKPLEEIDGETSQIRTNDINQAKKIRTGTMYCLNNKPQRQSATMLTKSEEVYLREFFQVKDGFKAKSIVRPSLVRCNDSDRMLLNCYDLSANVRHQKELQRVANIRHGKGSNLLTKNFQCLQRISLADEREIDVNFDNLPSELIPKEGRKDLYMAGGKAVMFVDISSYKDDDDEDFEDSKGFKIPIQNIKQKEAITTLSDVDKSGGKFEQFSLGFVSGQCRTNVPLFKHSWEMTQDAFKHDMYLLMCSMDEMARLEEVTKQRKEREQFEEDCYVLPDNMDEHYQVDRERSDVSIVEIDCRTSTKREFATVNDDQMTNDFEMDDFFNQDEEFLNRLGGDENKPDETLHSETSILAHLNRTDTMHPFNIGSSEGECIDVLPKTSAEEIFSQADIDILTEMIWDDNEFD